MYYHLYITGTEHHNMGGYQVRDTAVTITVHDLQVAKRWTKVGPADMAEMHEFNLSAF